MDYRLADRFYIHLGSPPQATAVAAPRVVAAPSRADPTGHISPIQPWTRSLPLAPSRIPSPGLRRGQASVSRMAAEVGIPKDWKTRLESNGCRRHATPSRPWLQPAGIRPTRIAPGQTRRRSLPTRPARDVQSRAIDLQGIHRGRGSRSRCRGVQHDRNRRRRVNHCNIDNGLRRRRAGT